MMWGHSSHLWSASHATTPPTRRPCFGREYPVIRRISRRKKVSYTFIEQALCLFTEETNYKSSLSPFGIKMVDRVTGKPLHIDISDLPMKRGIITNRNKFILGPSGSGKSFFTNHMVRQYYEQNAHVLLVDTGNSYLGLCEMINRKTHGEDGIYLPIPPKIR